MPEDGGDHGYAHSDTWGLVIAGAGNLGTSVFRTDDGINFDDLAPLPVSGFKNCLVILDDTTLMAMGLGANEDEVYVYHGGEQNFWEQFPSLSVGRLGMSCGGANDGSGTVVVAAGGADGVSRLDVVEIFHLQEMQWHTGRCSKNTFYWF